MIDAADDVLDTEPKIEDELAGRPVLRRSAARYDYASRALPLLEYHLPGATRPLDVGDRVVVAAEQGIDSVADRQGAYRPRTGIEHHDLDVGAAGRWRPCFRRHTRAGSTIGFDHDVSRDRRRELTGLPRGIAQRLTGNREGEANRLPGNRYRGITRGASLVRDGNANGEHRHRCSDQGAEPPHCGFIPSSAANHSAPMKRDIR